MHDFQYVTKKTAAPVKEELLQLIHEVQDEVRKKFTFRYDFIGSSSRNMITQDMKSNIGFDFDVNFEVNDDEQNFSPKEIRLTIKNAIDKVAPKYGYSPCEDSTRVLTIKKVDRKRSRLHCPNVFILTLIKANVFLILFSVIVCKIVYYCNIAAMDNSRPFMINFLDC